MNSTNQNQKKTSSGIFVIDNASENIPFTSYLSNYSTIFGGLPTDMIVLADLAQQDQADMLKYKLLITESKISMRHNIPHSSETNPAIFIRTGKKYW
jgi:hypothetical protein